MVKGLSSERNTWTLATTLSLLHLNGTFIERISLKTSIVTDRIIYFSPNGWVISIPRSCVHGGGGGKTKEIIRSLPNEVIEKLLTY